MGKITPRNHCNMKILELNGHSITPCGGKHATHSVYGGVHSYKEASPLTEDFCKKLCTEHDAGERYSKDSRFTYTTHLVKEFKGFQMAAKAAVQDTIKKHYGNEVHYVLIEKLNSK